MKEITRRHPLVSYVYQPTGPLGRLARLVLTVVYALVLLSIVDSRGSARFRNPHILTEPAMWLLDAVMFITFILLVGALTGPTARRRAQIAAVIGSVLAVAFAAALGIVIDGAGWGFPLADVVWWFDVVMLVEGGVALVLAVVLRFPGCEIGVWRELLARARGGTARPEEGLACIVGLHLLDTWEARRNAA